MMKTIDRVVSDLAGEVDEWKQEALYWKAQYEKERTAYNDLLNQQLDQQKKDIGNLLMVALRSVPTEEGILILSDPKQ